MEGAKYFIEVWKPIIKTNMIYCTHGYIKDLQRSLASTKKGGFITIAVWYIKPKVKTP